MKFTNCAVLLLAICFVTTISRSQTLVERLYLMRAETTTFDPYSGMTHTCIVVLPDGHYRLERSFQNSSSTRPDDKIYVDMLPEASVKQLQAILDDEKFEQIETRSEEHTSELQSRGHIVCRLLLEKKKPK